MVVSCCWQKATKGMDLGTRKETFQHLLQDPAFQMLQPKTMTTSVESSIVCSIKHTLNQVKVTHSLEEMKFKRAACMMILSGERDGLAKASQTQMARCLGLHRQNLLQQNHAFSRPKMGSFPLQLCQRHSRMSTIVTSEIKELVFQFWESETRVSPNKKDICCQRKGRKVYKKCAVQLLDETQVYLIFYTTYVYLRSIR